MTHAYGQVHDWMLLAFFGVLAVRVMVMKRLRGDACVACGKTNGHSVGCPGRRGY